MSWSSKALAAATALILCVGLIATFAVGSTTTRNLAAHWPGGEHPRIAWDETARSGTPYRFELSTHCGVNYARFSHRWWEATPPAPEDREKWGFNFSWGTMTLVDDERATFTSDKGNNMVNFVPVPRDMLLGDRPARRDVTGDLVAYSCA